MVISATPNLLRRVTACAVPGYGDSVRKAAGQRGWACPGQVAPFRPENTPLPTCLSRSELSPILGTGRNQMPATKNRRSAPAQDQIPLPGFEDQTDCPTILEPETQNPSSDLSRTGRGQRGRSCAVPRQDHLSPSTRPYEVGTGTGWDGTSPGQSHNWLKIKDKINTNLPDTTCRPRCITCGRVENAGPCNPCALICTETAHPKAPKPGHNPPRRQHRTSVCLTTTWARVELHTATSGRQLLLVPRCPHCGYPHTHSAAPGLTHFRVAPCGRTYLLETDHPMSATTTHARIRFKERYETTSDKTQTREVFQPGEEIDPVQIDDPAMDPTSPTTTWRTEPPRTEACFDFVHIPGSVIDVLDHWPA